MHSFNSQTFFFYFYFFPVPLAQEGVGCTN